MSVVVNLGVTLSALVVTGIIRPQNGCEPFGIHRRMTVGALPRQAVSAIGPGIGVVAPAAALAHCWAEHGSLIEAQLSGRFSIAHTYQARSETSSGTYKISATEVALI
jgi:hypothetical protein